MLYVYIYHTHSPGNEAGVLNPRARGGATSEGALADAHPTQQAPA